MRHCDPNITAGTQTSCGLAENVFRAFAENYQSSGGTAPSTISATSPATGQSYAMTCNSSAGNIACSGRSGTRVAFPMQAVVAYGPVSTTATTPAPAAPGAPSPQAAPGSGIEGPGSSDHATDVQFCSTHSCIPNFPNGNGTIVQCHDSQWSHSGGYLGPALITAARCSTRSNHNGRWSVVSLDFGTSPVRAPATLGFPLSREATPSALSLHRAQVLERQRSSLGGGLRSLVVFEQTVKASGSADALRARLFRIRDRL